MAELKDLRQLVDYAAESYADKAFTRTKVRKENIDRSFAQFRKDTMAFSRTLQALHLLGAHVGIVGGTSYEYIVTYFGTVNSNGVIVPLDAQLDADALCKLLDRADARVFVYDDKLKKVAAAAREKCPKIEVYINLQKQEEGALRMADCLSENAGEFSVAIDREKMCTMLYTSGTTGKPKGVMLSHKNLITNVVEMSKNISVEPDDIGMSVLPIHHAFCFTCDVLMALFYGITGCLNDSMLHIARNLQWFQPTLMTIVPMIAQTMYNQILAASKKMKLVPKKVIARKALGPLRTLYCGGAHLSPQLTENIRKLGIKIYQGYGMTESAPVIAANSKEHDRLGSVGKVLGGTQVKTVDDEVWVKSDSVMLGYYNDPERTAETLTEDGWLRTGDLGYMDKDGFLFLTGRAKNLIILSNGENVSPEELEDALSDNPVVGEVLVYGSEEGIVAEIYPNAEMAAALKVKDIPAALQALVDKVNDALPPYKMIRRLVVRDVEFEKTTSRKIKRNQPHFG